MKASKVLEGGTGSTPSRMGFPLSFKAIASFQGTVIVYSLDIKGGRNMKSPLRFISSPSCSSHFTHLGLATILWGPEPEPLNQELRKVWVGGLLLALH